MSNDSNKNIDIASILERSSKQINSLYDGLSYYDLYGSSVAMVFIITLFVFLGCSYFSLMLKSETIKSNWAKERCNPTVLPFAGAINAPNGESKFNYTKDNFTYCVQEQVSQFSRVLLHPIETLAKTLANLYSSIGGSINKMREMIARLRKNISVIAQTIYKKLMNVTEPLIHITVTVLDMMRKAQGVLTAGINTMIASYMTLQSLLGSMVELIIKILLIMLGVIIALWATPITWGAAASTSAVFTAIAIPLAIIAAILAKVMNVQTSKIPKLKCFDGDTLFPLANGTQKPIRELELGDVLLHSGQVVSKMRLSTTGVQMYCFRGIQISGTHMVHYKDKWIRVALHPEAVLVARYDNPYIYCINTSTKRIYLEGELFTDWDEVYDSTLQRTLQRPVGYKNHENLSTLKIEKEENIHKYLDAGFSKDARIQMEDGTNKAIENVQVGDILYGGDEVYGVVEVDARNMHKTYQFCLGGLRDFYGSDSLIFVNPASIPERKEIKDSSSSSSLCGPTLHHLLTTSGKCCVNGVWLFDYNSAIDAYLQQIV